MEPHGLPTNPNSNTIYPPLSVSSKLKPVVNTKTALKLHQINKIRPVGQQGIQLQGACVPHIKQLHVVRQLLLAWLATQLTLAALSFEIASN